MGMLTLSQLMIRMSVHTQCGIVPGTPTPPTVTHVTVAALKDAFDLTTLWTASATMLSVQTVQAITMERAPTALPPLMDPVQMKAHVVVPQVMGEPLRRLCAQRASRTVNPVHNTTIVIVIVPSVSTLHKLIPRTQMETIIISVMLPVLLA